MQSPTGSITPRTSTSGDGSITAPSYASSTPTFQASQYPPSGSPHVAHKRSASEAQLSEAESFSQPSPAAATTSGGARDYGQMSSSYSMQPATHMGGQEHFIRSSPQSMDHVYSEGSNSQFTSYSPGAQALPLVRIPEESYIPGLAYAQDKSPWCSSASDSTYSNSEGSRTGRLLDSRPRSTPLVTAADWSAPAAATQWPPAVISSNTAQDGRGPSYDMLEQYEGSYASPPLASRQRLDVPASSTFGGYYMESVGTALSAYKPMAQQLPASASRISNTGLASLDRSSKEFMGYQHVGPVVLSPTQSAGPSSDVSSYIASFWKHFDPLFPVIHKTTKFEDNNLLTSAMAALGTQYHDTPEARQRGAELNDFCRRTIDLVGFDSLDRLFGADQSV